MSGSKRLSDEEKQEMILDAEDASRKEAFRKARISSQLGSLDDYIEFLSRNMKHVEWRPVKRVTKDFRL